MEDKDGNVKEPEDIHALNDELERLVVKTLISQIGNHSPYDDRLVTLFKIITADNATKRAELEISGQRMAARVRATYADKA